MLPSPQSRACVRRANKTARGAEHSQVAVEESTAGRLCLLRCLPSRLAARLEQQRWERPDARIPARISGTRTQGARAAEL